MHDKNRIEVEHGNTLSVGGGLKVSFQRTLRIPDDGRTYPLPPGLGAFPIRRVADYANRVPAEWLDRGGVFIPLYQREAMWMCFSGSPHALKIGVGKVCAISGERWRPELARDPQNYVVVPHQPWLDGIASGKGTIRQFVAVPLGQGYTVEGQVTGEEKEGGVQLQAYPPKPGMVQWPPNELRCESMQLCAPSAAPARAAKSASLGLAAGGRMKQKIYPDPYGLNVWDTSVRLRVFVHIVNSATWEQITGEAAPATPVSAKSYAQAGLPWFDLYDEHAQTLSPTPTLQGIKSLKELEEAPVEVGPIKKLAHFPNGVLPVTDGDW